MPACIHIFSTKRPKKRHIIINNIPCVVRTVMKETLFGLESIVEQQNNISITDPARTIIDLLIVPQLGGGRQSIIEIFNQYLNSSNKNVELLFYYAKKTCNGAVLKRLGYLLEYCKSGEQNIIKWCSLLKTEGHIKFDPNSDGNKLLTRWGLWI